MNLRGAPFEGLEKLRRSRFILAYEARVADKIGGKNGGKPAFQALSLSLGTLQVMGEEWVAMLAGGKPWDPMPEAYVGSIYRDLLRLAGETSS